MDFELPFGPLSLLCSRTCAFLALTQLSSKLMTSQCRNAAILAMYRNVSWGACNQVMQLELRHLCGTIVQQHPYMFFLARKVTFFWDLLRFLVIWSPGQHQ